MSELNPIPAILKPINKSLYFGKWFHDFSEHKECFEYSKTRFYDLKKGSVCQFNNIEYATTITISNNGERFNGYLESAKRVSIIAIGDSVTMGWGVSNNETYSSVLEEILQLKTLNLGVTSYNTSRELEKLINYKDFINARIIVIQYHENDFLENLSYLKNGQKYYTIDDYNAREEGIINTYSWHTGGYEFLITLKNFLN